MEEKLINLLDTLDIEQTESLLAPITKMEMDKKAIARIETSVFNKVGLKKRFPSMRFITASIAAVFIFTMTFFIGFDTVADALGKVFSFIPGYGVMENNETIEYILDGKNLSEENESTRLTLKNVVATKESITAILELEKLNFNEADIAKEKEKDKEELLKNDHLKNPTITLESENKLYETGSYVMCSGGRIEQITITFNLGHSRIKPQTQYTIRYQEYNLSIGFQFKKIETYGTLDEIGSTQTCNNISITATSEKKDGKLIVELYPINKNGYRITSLSKENEGGYDGKDLHLDTDKGTKPYTKPDSSMGLNMKFYFDILPEEKDQILNIPFLIIESNESKNMSLPIPKLGKKLTVNKEVSFEDSTMIITDVERVSEVGSEFDSLYMNVKYKNKNANKVMKGAQLSRLNILGMDQSGGYSGKHDENDIVTSYSFCLEKGENSTLRLNIKNPSYYLIGEYNLRLN